MSQRCDRFERERLADTLDDHGRGSPDHGGPEELAAHLESCADCRADRLRYERIAHALADLGDGVQRRSDHVARVLTTAAADPSLRRAPPRLTRRAAQRIGPVLAVAAAIAVVWWLRRDRAPEAPRFAVEIVARGPRRLRSDPQWGDPQRGDRVRVTARPGAALWIYRNDRELLRACPRDCHRDGDRLVTELDLDSIGRYQIVWLSTDAVPPPTGNVERDIAAARAAGAVHELRDVDVQ